MSKIIELKNVSREFGEKDNKIKVVNDVSFSIDEGDFVVILGHSGAGKSTVLNMIAGMDTPTQGSIIVEGKDISKYKDKELTDYRAKKIGYVFQSYNLVPSLKAVENVALIKSLFADCEEPEKMLELVGLSEHKDKFPAQLSGGEQQRVSIARALCKKSPIILGDEPTGALDTESGINVISILQDLCKNQNKTVIIVTHNPDYAECANKVIMMKDGKIVNSYENENPKNISEVIK